MAVPKRKKSKMRIRMRKSAQKASVFQVQECPECGAPQRSHRACPTCGKYRGRQMMSVEVD